MAAVEAVQRTPSASTIPLTLKSTQNYDQSTLDNVSVFQGLSANVGLLSGLLYSFVAFNRCCRIHFLSGQWVVLAMGGLLLNLGLYCGSYSQTAGTDDVLVYVHGCSFADIMGDVVTGVMNFSDYSGTIVGIMKGFLGLGGALLIQFYDTIWKGNPSTFVLIFALLPTLVSLLLICLLKIP